MKCDDVQMHLPDYEAGKLAPRETADVRRHLETCASCAEELAAQRRLDLAFKLARPPAPGPRLRTAFSAWLDAEGQAAARAPSPDDADRPWWSRHVFSPAVGAIAASIVFVAGLLLGAWMLPEPAAPVRDEVTARELAELRQQIAAMNKAVAWSLLQQKSANERLQTVLDWNTPEGGPAAVNELLGVLAYDSDSSVRLSAVEALYRHADQPTVRVAVANALTREPSPLVQLAMIDLLATTRDPAAAAALQSIAQNDSQGEVVRDAAMFALARM